MHMKTEGKKRKNSKVLVIGGSSPNKQDCDTGSYQRRAVIKTFKDLAGESLRGLFIK
ncbi:MAG: hypothetical protein ACI4XH_02670 [Acutalibacteraceae bacterium]